MFACLYVPNFPVQAALRAEPGLRAHALAIVDGAPPLERVAAMNEFARRSGVQLGMPKALLEQCASVAVRHRSLEQETAAHAALLAAAREFSPRVEETSADAIALDLTGMKSLLGPLDKIAADLKQRAAACGLDVHVAIAANPDAASAAARGFAGITVIPAGREAQALAKLPTAILFDVGAGLAPLENGGIEILDTLDRWGIRNFGALAALPTAQLSERLGQAGVRLQLLARGAAERSLVCQEAPPEFAAAIELEYPVEELEPLAFILGRLLDELCARLSEHALATNELRVRMELDAAFEKQNRPQSHRAHRPEMDPSLCSLCLSGNLYEKTLALPVPMRDSKLLLNLLRLHLAAHPPQAPITKVFIAAVAARSRTAQSGLFVPLAPDPQKLEVTLARIANVVGQGNVGSPELLDTHRPGAFHMNRFVLSEEKFVGANFSSPAGEPKLTPTTIRAHPCASAVKKPALAMRVFRPPPKAIVEVRDGAPAQVSFSGICGAVLAVSGPWRTSGDWWQHNTWQCDEWDVEMEVAASTTAGFYRLVHNLAFDAWFVRGEYD